MLWYKTRLRMGRKKIKYKFPIFKVNDNCTRKMFLQNNKKSTSAKKKENQP